MLPAVNRLPDGKLLLDGTTAHHFGARAGAETGPEAGPPGRVPPLWQRSASSHALVCAKEHHYDVLYSREDCHAR